MSSAPKRKIIPGVKDANGIFTKQEIVEEAAAEKSASSSIILKPEVELSIDSELKKGLYAIHKIMNAVLLEAVQGAPSRESVQNLKDCMAMLTEMKKKEDDLLDTLSDEELEAIAKK